uniref:Uncharacterized protein n=1 Tax=Spongospora subterranea TaxID=70186 RepID=A0A0H5QWH6_9EUKA|eukprot:CRZ05986.1 hypothetical protein [Spongospora subterranea]
MKNHRTITLLYWENVVRKSRNPVVYLHFSPKTALISKAVFSDFNLHRSVEYMCRESLISKVLVIVTLLGRIDMKSRGSEDGLQLVITITDTFGDATPFIDPALKSIAEVLADPESRILGSLFTDGPPACYTYRIWLGEPVLSGKTQRVVKNSKGNPCQMLINLTVREEGRDDSSMESL